MNRLRIDHNNFVWFGNYRLPAKYIPERNALEFCDTDKRAASVRGTRFVEVPIETLRKLEDNNLTFGGKKSTIG